MISIGMFLWQVFEKASQLIKVSKSQIAFHVQQKRYDAIAAVYNILLDEELKRAYMLNSGKTKVTQHSQKDSVIRVSIKSVVSDREETESKNGNQDLSCSKDWEGQPKIGQDRDGEQDSTRKQNAQKSKWVVLIGSAIKCNDSGEKQCDLSPPS